MNILEFFQTEKWYLHKHIEWKDGPPSFSNWKLRIHKKILDSEVTDIVSYPGHSENDGGVVCYREKHLSILPFYFIAS